MKKITITLELHARIVTRKVTNAPSVEPISKVGKSLEPIDVASIFLARRQRGETVQHLFTVVTLYIEKVLLQICAMIDCGSTWNFLSQIKVKEAALRIPVESPPPSELKTLYGTPL